jgi:hypothetical protein
LPKDTLVWAVVKTKARYSLCTARVHTVEVDSDAMSEGSVKITYVLRWSGQLYAGPFAAFSIEAEHVFERTEAGTRAALAYIKQCLQADYDKAKEDLNSQQRLVEDLEYHLSALEQHCFDGLTAREHNQLLKVLTGEGKCKATKKGNSK